MSGLNDRSRPEQVDGHERSQNSAVARERRFLKLRRRGPVRQPSQVLALGSAAWILGALLGALVVLTVALAAGWPPVEGLDHNVAPWAFHETYGHGVSTRIWTAVAAAGQPVVLRVLLILTGIFQFWRGRRLLAGWLIVVPLAENLIAPAAKYLLNRPRPHWLHPIAVQHSSSYPSGHAAGAGMFATAVLLLAFTTIRSTTAAAVIAACGLVVALTISADRIFLGVHYLSDVIGGGLLGAAITIAGWIALLILQRRRKTKDATA